MRVLEISSGAEPGPRFADATSYTAVITDPESAAFAAQAYPDIQVEAGRADMLAYADDSFDIVVARNVLGDPYLGVPRNQVASYLNVLTSQKRPNKTLIRSMNTAVAHTKLETVKEAMRTLVPGGFCVVVEDLMPVVTVDFFRQHEHTLATQGIITSRMHNIAESVLPEDYKGALQKKYRADMRRGIAWLLQSSVRTQK